MTQMGYLSASNGLFLLKRLCMLDENTHLVMALFIISTHCGRGGSRRVRATPSPALLASSGLFKSLHVLNNDLAIP